MTYYRFSLNDGRGETGCDRVELAGLDAAKLEAARLAGAMLVDHPESVWTALDWTLLVTDDQGLSLFGISVTATEAPAVRP